jgi:hypothetical protein
VGRVKELLPEPDEYSGHDDYGYEQELEMLAVDAEQARARYLEALKKHNNQGSRNEPV